MNFEETISEINKQLSPQLVVDLYKLACDHGFRPDTERCVNLIFPSPSAMLKFVRGDGAEEPVAADNWTFEDMNTAFSINTETLNAFQSRTNSLLITTAIQLDNDQLYIVSVTCIHPK